MILLDTNIVIRLLLIEHTNHDLVKQFITEIKSEGESFAIVPQIIYEFWVVATRPTSVNGLGILPSECQLEISNLKKLAKFLPDKMDLFTEWENLVIKYECKGKSAHDARIVAAMKTYGLNRIMTFNGADFQRYAELDIITPKP